MGYSDNISKAPHHARQAGFSLVEMMIVLAILTVVGGIVSMGMFRMTQAQTSNWNRTEMHSAVRSATELIQQEIGQAGGITLPNRALALGAAVPGSAATTEVGINVVTGSLPATSGMFPGMVLVIGPQAATCGAPPVPAESRETVTVLAVNTSTNTITAKFQDCHSAGAVVSVAGSFAAGIVPVSGGRVLAASATNPVTLVPTTMTATTGSSPTLLKLFGDINDDGNMVYVEYTCDLSTTPGRLRRRMMPWNTTAANKPNFPFQDLLTNVRANPTGTPCFQYRTIAVGNNAYTINVAITLTVQTEGPTIQACPGPGCETEALLNVSPRNVYQAWQMSGLGVTSRLQPMPRAILDLLP